MKIYAAMIEFNNGNDFAGVDAAGYDAFDNCLGRADALFQQHCNDPQAIKMFVAPEYYFSGHNVSDKGSLTVDSLSRSDKHSLYKKIEQSSKLYPNVLIVPGSIAYSKARGFSKRKYYSVCPIAAGGKIIHKHYKTSNDTFQTETDYKTKANGSTFNYKNKRMGIDICLDHGKAVLKDSLNGGVVDVHILISDGSAPSSTKIATDTNGLMVFCDMKGKQLGANGVKKVSLNKYQNFQVDNQDPIAETAQPMAGSGRVALYYAEA